MKIHDDDYRMICDAAKRVLRGKRCRVEFRRCWVRTKDGREISTFNRADISEFIDIDDTYSHRYTRREFEQHSKHDPRCDLNIVTLDIMVQQIGSWGGDDFDFLYARFVDGRLIPASLDLITDVPRRRASGVYR